MPNAIALIPARAGSSRVVGKNVRPLAGHPLLAYSIAAAKQSGLFDRVVVTTDSEAFARIARHYGAEVPFLRPAELATSVSPDIEWIKHAFRNIEGTYDCFSIVRPTSPFRLASTFVRAWDQFVHTEGADSIRAVELCHEHPGKMWTLKGELMDPLLPQSDLDVPWYDGQYQALPKVYVQNSALEIAWSRVVWEQNTRGGSRIAPFLTEGHEGFSIDYEEDWERAELLVREGKISLPPIDVSPYAAQPGKVSP